MYCSFWYEQTLELRVRTVTVPAAFLVFGSECVSTIQIPWQLLTDRNMPIGSRSVSWFLNMSNRTSSVLTGSSGTSFSRALKKKVCTYLGYIVSQEICPKPQTVTEKIKTSRTLSSLAWLRVDKLWTLRHQKWPCKNQTATAAPCYCYPYLAKTEWKNMSYWIIVRVGDV